MIIKSGIIPVSNRKLINIVKLFHKVNIIQTNYILESFRHKYIIYKYINKFIKMCKNNILQTDPKILPENIKIMYAYVEKSIRKLSIRIHAKGRSSRNYINSSRVSFCIHLI